MSLENEIIGVDHLGILTGDLKRDVAWYEEKLGFEKIQQRIVVMNGRTEIALLKKENLVLELVEPAGRLKDEAAHLSNGKWDHFAMEAPELEREAALAKEKGLKVHLSTPEGLTFYEHLGEKGVRGINFYGPGGEVLEFCRDEALAYHEKSGLTGWSHLALKVENMESIPKELPIYIIAGDKDPVGRQGKGILDLYDRYKKLNIKDVNYKLYENGRHEILNEINKDEVIDDILIWMNGIL